MIVYERINMKSERDMVGCYKDGEYMDLYDSNKKLTGEVKFREKGEKLEVPSGRYIIVVLAFIQNSKGEFLFQNNVSYIVILWGGFTTNFIWCLYLLVKNRTYKDYAKIKAPLKANYLWSALAGTMWYMQFFFYGMGESKLGNGASSWILHMAFIILISNAWGVILKEWKGASKPAYRSIIAGIAIMMLAICVVGFARTLE